MKTICLTRALTAASMAATFCAPRFPGSTVETRIGLRKAFGPVVVPESSLSRSRDGFGRARDSHYLVPVGTLQQFRNDGSAQTAAGATYTDFHVNLQYLSNEQIKFPATFAVISITGFATSTES